VASNLFGDIITDLGAMLQGGMGFAAGANINPEKTYPSMFEPIHGSAPDIAGQGIANPIGAIWSGAIMLEHLGRQKAAESIVRAIEMTVGQGVLPVDLGGSAKTVEIADTIVRNLKSDTKDDAPSN
jgi:tartrate dehydrogenase/decarboxylase/D-malate dehydrogenase